MKPSIDPLQDHTTPLCITDDRTSEPLNLPSLDDLFTPSIDPLQEHITPVYITSDPLSLPSLDDLFATIAPIPKDSALFGTLINSQRGSRLLVYEGRCYTVKRTLKSGDISWRCCKRSCKGVLRTTTEYQANPAFPQRPQLSEVETAYMIGESKLADDCSSVSTRQLAANWNHPYSTKLYKRRWRKSRASSGAGF